MSGSAFAQCNVEAYFSPYDDVETVVVDRLSGAQETINCSLYGITNAKITQTLIDKMSEGVSVTLCLDKTQSAGKSSTHKKLKAKGADIVIKKSAVLEHNKFCVIDGTRVIMGSWNYSGNAQKQDNSMVEITACNDIIDKFEAAFERIYQRDK
jgi:phosphatidylserine/phosphatidylglycerophosphate/cardiolipin synthase-like enzyme